MVEQSSEFKDKLAAMSSPATGQGESPSEIQFKRPRGRPKKVIEPPPPPPAKPVPVCNETEALLFAQMIAGIANAFVKKEYKDKLKFEVEELLNVTRPMVILKEYYLPNLGGIYAVWTQFAIAGGALGIQKYNKMKELMQDDKPREENNPNIRDSGDGQVNKGEGTTQVTAENPSL